MAATPGRILPEFLTMLDFSDFSTREADYTGNLNQQNKGGFFTKKLGRCITGEAKLFLRKILKNHIKNQQKLNKILC